MEDLKIGDVVGLIGNIGPRMVVESISEPNYINCVWFDTHNVFHEKSFKRSILTLWMPPGKPEPTKSSSGGTYPNYPH